MDMDFGFGMSSSPWSEEDQRRDLKKARTELEYLSDPKRIQERIFELEEKDFNNNMKVINFYQTKGPYGPFSNFSRHSFMLDGKSWPTSEHYFQAMKFTDLKIQETIRELKSPAEAAKMGRNRYLPLRKDWENVKDNIMRKAVWAKFNQYQSLKDLLLSTDNDMLVEHTKNDKYWADAGDGTGINMLGLILMEIRNKFRSGVI